MQEAVGDDQQLALLKSIRQQCPKAVRTAPLDEHSSRRVEIEWSRFRIHYCAPS